AGCISTATVATINGAPTAPSAPTVTTTDPASCTDVTGTITVTTPAPAAGITYSMDGVNYSNTNGIFTGVAPGTYNVTVKNAAGCISSATTATINGAPAGPTLNINNPATVCAPNTVDLTAPPVTAGSDAGLTYTYWTDANTTAALANPGAVISGGTYYIKAT